MPRAGSQVVSEYNILAALHVTLAPGRPRSMRRKMRRVQGQILPFDLRYAALAATKEASKN